MKNKLVINPFQEQKKMRKKRSSKCWLFILWKCGNAGLPDKWKNSLSGSKWSQPEGEAAHTRSERRRGQTRKHLGRLPGKPAPPVAGSWHRGVTQVVEWGADVSGMSFNPGAVTSSPLPGCSRSFRHQSILPFIRPFTVSLIQIFIMYSNENIFLLWISWLLYYNLWWFSYRKVKL